MTRFDLILHFMLVLSAVRLCAKFEVSSFNSPRYIRGRNITKVGQVTPHDPFLSKFEFFSLVLTAIRIRAKFEVSVFNRYRDIRGS